MDQSPKKTPFYFYLILILIPLIIILLLEISLRIFNYGTDNRQWIEASEGKLILNPEIAKRYFSTTGALPYSIQDVFDAEKKQNTFRIFVLGESSAAGYPYLPVGSFSRYIKKRLELFYPEYEIEVVNISMTAINSYTLLDLFPGVADQKPDAVLIYTGHNEYYGALGAASVESSGSSRFLKILSLKLKRFKVTELVNDAMRSAVSLFSGEENRGDGGTIMSGIAKDKYISLNSDMYNEGISQFSENMRGIFSIAKENNIKIICGSLTSNYKDQFPFISVDDNYPRADLTYEKAQQYYADGLFSEADSLFRSAKELDALRFRAPEKINLTLQELCREFNFPLINIDSLFAAESPDGIIGNNLMTDHLHPNLEGYFLIGDLFYREMEKLNMLPESVIQLHGGLEQDSLTRLNFHFSELDSIIAGYRIKVLKNDWPYRTSGSPLPLQFLLNPENHLDSIAYKVADGSITWAKAQRGASEYFLQTGNISMFKKQMDVLISQYNVVSEFYESAAAGLMKYKDFKNAFAYLEKADELKPGAYSSKWLGAIYFSRNNLDKALEYLSKSLEYNYTDPQVHYNIAGVYIKKKENKQALFHLDECLRIQPDFPAAARVRKQLISFLNK